MTNATGPNVQVRQRYLNVERIEVEAGQELPEPITKVVAAAVFVNPFARRYVDDLTPLYDVSEQLGAELAEAAVGQLPGPAESYGKGAIVGTGGELEHAAALLHPRLGAPLRAAVGGGKSIIPSAKKRGGPGSRSTSRCTIATLPSFARTSMPSSSARTTRRTTMSWS